MFSFFRRRHPRATRATSRPRCALQAAAPMLETLEDRTLLSAPALGYSSYLPGIAYAVAADSAGDVFAADNANGSRRPISPACAATPLPGCPRRNRKHGASCGRTSPTH